MRPYRIFELHFHYTYAELIASKTSQSVIQKPFLMDQPYYLSAFNDYAGKLKVNNEWKPHIQNLLEQLYARFWKHCCFALHKEVALDDLMTEASDEITDVLGNIVMIILQTYDRYAKLLDIYASESSKLLDGIKTTTSGVGRFNDTPQNITDGDEFGDNTHVSNITKSTAEAISDADTKMARIDEIDRRYRNILKDWTNEFEGLFIEGENYL